LGVGGDSSDAVDDSVLDNVDIVGAAAGGKLEFGGGDAAFGTDTTLKALGSFGITREYGTAELMTNNGLIEAAGKTGTTFIIDALGFSNSGTLSVADGGTMEANAVTFSNLSTAGGAVTLTGGVYDVGAKSVFAMLNFYTKKVLPIADLQASVTLNGAGATFTNIADLSTIGARGVLLIENGAALTFGTNFTIDGYLHLAASDSSAKTITVASGGKLGGHGAVLGSVVNNGLIDAFLGTLSISQNVTGSGLARVDNTATLQFGNDVAASQTVMFNGATGTIGIGFVAGFAATIEDFAPGGVIDLINTAADTVSYSASADTLTIKGKGTLVDTLQLSGSYSGDIFALASDGKGGTDITVAASAAAVHRFVEAVAASPSGGALATGSAGLFDSQILTPMLAAHHG
jgi:hypothetical protein